tara:strand:+ start:627 stop:887 length:261 start_codon:yes stop_codon:yes gene_type:complete
MESQIKTKTAFKELILAFYSINNYSKVAAITFFLAKLQFMITLLAMIISAYAALICWTIYTTFVWTSIVSATLGWIKQNNDRIPEN